MDKMQGGYQALQIRLLNGRIFQKLLEQGTRCPIPK